MQLGGAPNDANVAVIRYDIVGRREWQLVASRPGADDSAEDVVVGPDGSIAIWGFGSPDFGCGNIANARFNSFYVARLDAAGGCLFMRTLEVTEPLGFGAGGGVAIDPRSGDVLAVTTVNGPLLIDGISVWDGPTEQGDTDLVLLRFLPDDGELIGIASSAHGQLQVQDLGVDAEGRVTVSGTTYTLGADLGDGFFAPTRMAPSSSAPISMHSGGPRLQAALQYSRSDSAVASAIRTQDWCGSARGTTTPRPDAGR